MLGLNEAGAGLGLGELRQIFRVVEKGDIGRTCRVERADVGDEGGGAAWVCEFSSAFRGDPGQREGAGAIVETWMFHVFVDFENDEGPASRGLRENSRRPVLELGRRAEAEEFLFVEIRLGYDIGEVCAKRSDRRIPQQARTDR